MTIPVSNISKKLRYNPDKGFFFWKNPGGGHKAGAVAGYKNIRGYVVINIKRTPLYAHRIAWAMTHGKWPKEIDHANGCRSDNRIANLRIATRTQNNANAKKRTANTSGRKGVFKRGGRYFAYINVNKKRISLGTYSSLVAAAKARSAAENKYFDIFARAE